MNRAHPVYLLGVPFLFCIGLSISLAASPLVVQIVYLLDDQPVRSPLMLQSLQKHTRNRVGLPLSRYETRQSIEAIYGMGAFGNVEVTATPQPEGLLLKFLLTSRQLIGRVRLVGSPLAQDLLHRATRSRSGDEYIPEIVERDRLRLRDLHREQGYFRASVDWSTVTEGGRVALRFDVTPGNLARVREITFEGAASIRQSKLRDRLQLNPGKSYRKSLMEADAKRLLSLYRGRGYLTARIESQADYQNTADEVIITYRISEGKRVRVEVEGRDIDKEEVRKRLFLFQQSDYSPTTLNRTVQQIKRFYEQQGYANVSASYQIVQETDREVAIRFRVDLGYTVRVRRVECTGNEAFDAATLREQMKLRPPSSFRLPGLKWLLSSGSFDADVLELDRRAVELFYKKRGYAHAVVTVRWEFADENDVDIHFQIHEGKQQRVRMIAVTGTTLFSPGTLVRSLRVQVGEPYNPDAVTQDVLALKARYDTRGYVYAQVEPEFDAGRGALFYHVTEGPPVRLGAIRFFGNEGVPEGVLLREFEALGQLPESLLNPAVLDQVQKRLFRLGLFRAVRIEMPGRFEGEPRKQLDVQVHLERRRAGSVGISGGYSPSEGYQASLELSHDNLFYRNMRTDLETSLGTRGNLYEWRLTEPHLPLPGLGTSVATLQLFEDNLEEFEQTRARGGSVGLSRWIREQSQIALHYKYQRLRQTQAGEAALQTTVSSLGISFRHDSRDHILNPGRGRVSELTLEYAGGVLRGETSFLKLTTDHRLYRPIGRALFALAGRFGYEQGLRGNRSREVIGVERFWAGGSTTLRGYRERSLGPLTSSGGHRGDLLLILNSELRFPIYRLLGGVLFFETGNVWDAIGDIDTSPLHSDLGAGLRVDTPLGPVRFDMGFPLRRGFDAPRYWLELGHAF